MDAILTHLYFLTFVACLLSSCTSDAPDNVEISRGAEMSFAVSGLSRASVTTSFNEFTVYGDMNKPENDATSSIKLFDKTQVVYNGNNWSYNGTQYWYPKYEHSFVAVSPSSVLNPNNTPRYSNSKLSFTYTIPTATGGILSQNSNVADIIAATHRRLYNETDKNTTTTFKFGHILSLINFAPVLDDKIMTTEEYIQFHKLEFSGVRTKAEISILPESRQSNLQTDDIKVYVNGQEGSESKLTIQLAKPVKVKNDQKNVSLFDSNDAIIMLPQTFAADSKAQVVLTYTINDDPLQKEITIPLDKLKWESGKSYLYKFTFTLERTGVEFEDCKIIPWNEIQGEVILE